MWAKNNVELLVCFESYSYSKKVQDRVSGSKGDQLAAFSWQLANCRGRPVCLPELALVIDTDSDSDGEP